MPVIPGGYRSGEWVYYIGVNFENSSGSMFYGMRCQVLAMCHVSTHDLVIGNTSPRFTKYEIDFLVQIVWARFVCLVYGD